MANERKMDVNEEEEKKLYKSSIGEINRFGQIVLFRKIYSRLNMLRL